MNEKNLEIEQFLTWFAAQEDIPLQIRRDLFAHIKNVGGLDQKAVDYIDQAVALIEQKNTKKVMVIKAKLDLVIQALENQEEFKQHSLPEKIVNDISQWFLDRVQIFKSKRQTEEMQILKSEETMTHEVEMDEVATLKAAL